jgi:hypothetical protein
VRAPVERILSELLARHGGAGHVHLNDLAEAIGAEPVTPDEIDALVERLEAAGLRVGEPLDGLDVMVIRQVVASARRLRAALGRAPTADEIAEESGHTPHAVRRALKHAAAAKPPQPGS